MALVSMSGLTKSSTKASIATTKSMAMGSINGQMAVDIWAFGKMVSSMVSLNTKLISVPWLGTHLSHKVVSVNGKLAVA